MESFEDCAIQNGWNEVRLQSGIVPCNWLISHVRLQREWAKSVSCPSWPLSHRLACSIHGHFDFCGAIQKPPSTPGWRHQCCNDATHASCSRRSAAHDAWLWAHSLWDDAHNPAFTLKKRDSNSKINARATSVFLQNIRSECERNLAWRDSLILNHRSYQFFLTFS